MSNLASIDQLVVPADLSGRTGRNRSTGLAQIQADDDRSAVLAWLARYADSPATLASYRKEAADDAWANMQAWFKKYGVLS